MPKKIWICVCVLCLVCQSCFFVLASQAAFKGNAAGYHYLKENGPGGDIRTATGNNANSNDTTTGATSDSTSGSTSEPTSGAADESNTGGATESSTETSTDVSAEATTEATGEAASGAAAANPADVAEKPARLDDVVSIQVPDNINFSMDQFGLEKGKQIYSKRYFFRNKGKNPIFLYLMDIQCSLEGDIWIADDAMTDREVRDAKEKVLRLFIALENGDNIPVTEDGSGYELVLEPGEAMHFSIEGCMSENVDNDWEDGDVQIDLMYRAEIYDEAEDKTEGNTTGELEKGIRQEPKEESEKKTQQLTDGEPTKESQQTAKDESRKETQQAAKGEPEEDSQQVAEEERKKDSQQDPSAD